MKCSSNEDIKEFRLEVFAWQNKFLNVLASIVSYMLGITKSLKFFSHTFSQNVEKILSFETLLAIAGIFSVSTTVSDWLPGALSTRSIASSLLTGT